MATGRGRKLLSSAACIIDARVRPSRGMAAPWPPLSETTIPAVSTPPSLYLEGSCCLCPIWPSPESQGLVA